MHIFWFLVITIDGDTYYKNKTNVISLVRKTPIKLCRLVFIAYKPDSIYNLL